MVVHYFGGKDNQPFSNLAVKRISGKRKGIILVEKSNAYRRSDLQDPIGHGVFVQR